MPLALLGLVFFAWVRPVQAEQKTIEIPKGAKIQKLGPGHFKFVLPNDRIIELKGLDPRASEAATIELVDPNPPHKPVSGRQVTLRLKRLTHEEALKLGERDYVRIDDDIAWLPLSMTFQVTGLVGSESLLLRKSSTPPSPAPAPPTHKTALAPAVIAHTLPIRIDSIQMGPKDWIPEGARCNFLLIKGTRTVAGEIWHPVKVDLLWNGTSIRSGSIGIFGHAGPFAQEIRIDWPFLPGAYQVKLEYDSQSYTSREFQTEMGYRFIH